MKRIVFFATSIVTFLSAEAQTKSTGTVTLPVSGMTAKLDLSNTSSTATLTLAGPSDRWFALQFGSFGNGGGMQAGQDVVYYNGTTLIDAVHNGIGSAPSADANNWTVTSNTVAAGTRTLVATRALDTGNTNDYAFAYADNSIDFACAMMNSASFQLAYHGGANRGYSLDTPLSANLGAADFELDKMAFYPNPASAAFSIRSDDEIAQVSIYDSTGRQVAVFRNQKESIDISNLPSGVYFAEIENGSKEISVKKFVKQ